MSLTLTHPTSPAAADDPGEDRLWLPPRRLRRYTWAKIVTSTIIAATFVGWMWLQWSSPMMRLAAPLLLVITCWVLVRSIAEDYKRARGRQIAVEGDTLEVTDAEQTCGIAMSRIAKGQWLDDPADRRGLHLLDAEGKPLVHLNEAFLADEAEARAFLGWLRQQSQARFDVQWSAPSPLGRGLG
ncbi:MAG: hypothetical protein WD042_03705 [Phycisphaeraceae bacterium]